MSTNFMQSLQNVLGEEYNTSITENGAVGYRTSGKELLDINFSISSLRNMSEREVAQKFKGAFLENELLAVKWLFYAADVREGIGERRLFRICMNWLTKEHREYAKAVLGLIPEYTRWDNLIILIDTDLQEDVAKIVKEQLTADLLHMEENKPISLLGKWMPSANAHSGDARRRAKVLMQYLKVTDRRYRKMLSSLRAYLKVVEVSMSANEWNAIDYASVPSRANLRYKDAFMKHDEDRRREFLDSLEKGETKINAGVLFPHDIVHKYCRVLHDVTLEELWKALPDYVNGNGNTICVADGSGSMTSRAGGWESKSDVSCLEVANALAIYFAERSSGQFKDKYITFSEHPQLVDFSSATTLKKKLEIAGHYSEVANTNIEAVFELILTTAIKMNMTQEDLPQNILILSDMEFDDCACSNNVIERSPWGFGRNIYAKPESKMFNIFKERYEAAGYKLPRLVFWNISSRTGTIPVKENDLGIALVSGFSPAIAKMVLSNSTDPFECLLEQINAERYTPVEDAIKEI